MNVGSASKPQVTPEERNKFESPDSWWASLGSSSESESPEVELGNLYYYTSGSYGPAGDLVLVKLSASPGKFLKNRCLGFLAYQLVVLMGREVI